MSLRTTFATFPGKPSEPLPRVQQGRPASSVWSYTIATWFWLAAVLLLPLVFVAGRAVAMPLFLTGIQFVILTYAATRLAWIIASGVIQPAVSMFWLFTYVAMGVAPFAQLATGRYPTPLRDTSTILEATVLVLAGCCAFDLGRLIQTHRSRPRDLPPQWSVRRPTRARLWALSLLGTLASLTYIVVVGGPETFFQTRTFLSETVRSATGTVDRADPLVALFSAAGQIPVLVAFLCWTAVIFSRTRQPSLSGRVWWVALAALNLVVNNPISNSRYFFLTVLISGLLIAPGLTPARFRRILITGVLAAIIAFPFADFFRQAPTGLAPRNGTPTTLAESLSFKDYDQTVMIANGLWWVRSFRGDYTYGRQLVGDVLFWVPRDIWPDKPRDTGVEIGSELQAGTPNLSSPLWIEAFVDFGWGGTIVVMALLGYWATRADKVYGDLRRGLHSRDDLTFVGLILPLLAGYLFILLRGPLLQAMGQLTVICATTWFVTAPSKPGEMDLLPPLTGPGDRSSTVGVGGQR